MICKVLVKTARKAFEEAVEKADATNVSSSWCSLKEFEEIFVDEDGGNGIFIYCANHTTNTYVKYSYQSWDSIREDNTAIMHLMEERDLSTDTDFYDWLRDESWCPFDEEDLFASDVVADDTEYFEDEVEEFDDSDVMNIHAELVAILSSIDEFGMFVSEQYADNPRFNIIDNDSKTPSLIEYKGFHFALKYDNGKVSIARDVCKHDENGNLCEFKVDGDIQLYSLEEEVEEDTSDHGIQEFNDNQKLAVEMFRNALKNLKANNVFIFRTCESSAFVVNTENLVKDKDGAFIYSEHSYDDEQLKKLGASNNTKVNFKNCERNDELCKLLEELTPWWAGPESDYSVILK